MQYSELFNFVLKSIYSVVEFFGFLSQPLPLLNISIFSVFTLSGITILLGWHLVRLVKG